MKKNNEDMKRSVCRPPLQRVLGDYHWKGVIDE